MDPYAVTSDTNHYNGVDVLLFSPCSHESISKLLHRRWELGSACFADVTTLGKCTGVQCGGPCSASYCNFATGACELRGQQRPDGWPCDAADGVNSNGAVAVCVAGTCTPRVLPPTNPAAQLLPFSIVLSMPSGGSQCAVTCGVYTRTLEASGGRATYVKQSQLGRYYTLSFGELSREPSDAGGGNVGWEVQVGPSDGTPVAHLKDASVIYTIGRTALDAVDLIANGEELPWTEPNRPASAKVWIAAGRVEDVCQTVAIDGLAAGGGDPRAANIYRFAGVSNGRPIYKADGSTYSDTGNAAQPIYFGWTEFTDATNREKFFWELTTAEPAVRSVLSVIDATAARVGRFFDYAATPDKMSKLSRVFLRKDGGGGAPWAEQDTNVFKVSCLAADPGYSTTWKLHTASAECPAWGSRRAGGGGSGGGGKIYREELVGQFSRDACATLCAARPWCDTFMIAAAGICRMLKGPCAGGNNNGDDGGGGGDDGGVDYDDDFLADDDDTAAPQSFGDGPYNIYRLGRGTCSTLEIDNGGGVSGSTASPPYVGSWANSGIERAGRPVFCDKSPCGANSKYLFYDPRWPGWAVQQGKNKIFPKSGSSQRPDVVLSGRYTVLELQSDPAARGWLYSVVGGAATTSTTTKAATTVEDDDWWDDDDSYDNIIDDSSTYVVFFGLTRGH